MCTAANRGKEMASDTLKPEFWAICELLGYWKPNSGAVQEQLVWRNSPTLQMKYFDDSAV